MKKKRLIFCPECNAEMILRNSKYGLFYGCSKFPLCNATHGAHPNGRPLGFPANKELKQLRIKAHRLCEQIWGEWKSENCDKKGMYKWLKKNTKTGHIAKMDKDAVRELIVKLLIKLQEI